MVKLIVFALFILASCDKNNINDNPKSYAIISNLLIDVAKVEIIDRTAMSLQKKNIKEDSNIDLNIYQEQLSKLILNHLEKRFFAVGIIGTLTISIDEAAIYYFAANKSRSYFHWINTSKSGKLVGKLLFRIKIKLTFNNPLIDNVKRNDIFIIRDFNLNSNKKNVLTENMPVYLDSVIRELQDQTGIELMSKIEPYIASNH